MDDEAKRKVESMEAKEIAAWLDTNWPGPKACPICKNNSWHIPKTVFELRTFHRGEIITPSAAIPLAPVTCKVCGFVLLFNAMIADLWHPEKEKVTGQPQPVKAEPSEKEGRS